MESDGAAWPDYFKISYLEGVTTRATSVVEGRKEGVIGRNNWKEYHSTSKARKVRSRIMASYCNILKVS